MKKLMYYVSFAIMAVMSVSCSNEESASVTPPTNEKTPKYATMLLNASKPSFEDEGTTRATTDNWVNGAKVYLQFKDAIAATYGIATYNKSTSEWNIIYYGTLTATNDGKCEAYFFENAGEESYLDIALTVNTIIYADKSASYTFVDNSLKVTANLKPMTGRIRFKGTANSKIYMEGLKYYSRYNFTTNTFDNSDLYYSVSTVNKDGYTDYLYCFFPEDAEKQIVFNDKEQNVSFYRTLGGSALVAGKSGFLNIPTMGNPTGWNLLRFKDYTVEDVTFRMMRVVGDENNTHYCRSFMVGEAEVTQALWKAVMNDNPSSPKGDDLPVNKVSWVDCEEFLDKLNTKTNGEFGLPTQAQWQWAAKGGYLSKGYAYSGSNVAGEVAWYSGNSNSTIHPVKTKLPNEIGLYDMSGNVSEWTSTKNSSGSYYSCGGSYTSGASYVMWNSAGNNGPGNRDNNIGLRLFSY